MVSEEEAKDCGQDRRCMGTGHGRAVRGMCCEKNQSGKGIASLHGEWDVFSNRPACGVYGGDRGLFKEARVPSDPMGHNLAIHAPPVGDILIESNLARSLVFMEVYYHFN